MPLACRVARAIGHWHITTENQIDTDRCLRHIFTYVGRSESQHSKPVQDAVLPSKLFETANGIFGHMGGARSMNAANYPLLRTIDSPGDLRLLSPNLLEQVASELRSYLIDTVS